jgi:hypothetical protein
MEEFFLNYVEELAEEKDLELSRLQVCEIVNNLMDSDELWDTIDSFIHNELNNIK